MITQQIPYHLAPNDSGDALKRYIEQRCPLGSFLTAIVSNDLAHAAASADIYNQKLLFEYAYWLHNYAPAECWGSREQVSQWLEGRKL